MKLSFSTLAVPDWKWTEIISIAKDLGFDGIEIRGIGNEIYTPNVKIFDSENIDKTINDLKSTGLGISCLSSDCVFSLDNSKDYVKEAQEYIVLASKIGARYIRVLGEKTTAPGSEANDEILIEKLKSIASFAAPYGVNILLETNGAYAKSERALKIIEEVGSSNVGILWDVMHPYNNFNEPLAQTYEKLKPYISHIHIKDYVIENGKVKYKMLTKGTFPVKELVDILKENKYDGYISLEWVKRWNSDLEDAGIVFAQFVSTMRNL